jgi:thioredoxin
MRLPATFAAAILLLAACQEGAPQATAPAPAAAAPVAAVAVAAEVPGIVHIASAKEFDVRLAQQRGLVVLEFHAEWCGPCKLLAPELEALVKANPGRLVVFKIDVDRNPELATRFAIDPIPVLVKLEGGKESARQVGFGGRAKLAAFLGLE